jgi:hypothetical protein
MATTVALRLSREPDDGPLYDFAPTIRLPWRYTPEQERKGDVWECGAVRLIRRGKEEVNANEWDCDLAKALDVLRGDVDAARYTLLVNPEGMSYDATRFGGDHQIRVPGSGRRFTLSVRRGRTEGAGMVLVAIDWGVF